jgi:hypothetical protein
MSVKFKLGCFVAVIVCIGVAHGAHGVSPNVIQFSGPEYGPHPTSPKQRGSPPPNPGPRFGAGFELNPDQFAPTPDRFAQTPDSPCLSGITHTINGNAKIIEGRVYDMVDNPLSGYAVVKYPDGGIVEGLWGDGILLPDSGP